MLDVHDRGFVICQLLLCLFAIGSGDLGMVGEIFVACALAGLLSFTGIMVYIRIRSRS